MQQIHISKYFFVDLLLLLTYLTGCSGISGLEKRAEQGDATAQYQYAFYLQTEKHDLAKARHWYELSAKQGNTYAQNNLTFPPFAVVTVKDNVQAVINPTAVQPQLGVSNDLAPKITTNQFKKSKETVGNDVCIEGDCINGRGTYVYDDGRKYTGESKNNMANGKGILTLPNGTQYVGEFKNDKPNGKVTATFPNGEKYVGRFKNGQRDGKATVTFPDGSKYVGEYKNDMANGKGTVTSPNGEKYVGELKDNMPNGHGTLTYANGEKYTGEFINGEPINGDKYLDKKKSPEEKEDERRNARFAIFGKVLAGLFNYAVTDECDNPDDPGSAVSCRIQRTNRNNR